MLPATARQHAACYRKARDLRLAKHKPLTPAEKLVWWLRYAFELFAMLAAVYQTSPQPLSEISHLLCPDETFRLDSCRRPIAVI